jgi:hypothetical protein
MQREKMRRWARALRAFLLVMLLGSSIALDYKSAVAQQGSGIPSSDSPIQ